MRKYFLTTAAAMAIATPALAGDISGAGGLSGGYTPSSGDPVLSSVPMIAGDLELRLGRVWEDSNKSDTDFNNFEGWARANVPVGDTWNILVEVGGGATFGGDLPDGSSFSTHSVNGHVWANRGDLRYGVFGGSAFGGFTLGTVGVEVEADFGNATLGAHGFYSWAEPCEGSCDMDTYGASGWLDYYVSPNTKATGTLTWSQEGSLCGSPCDATVLSATARLTHRLADTSFNLFGEATYLNSESELIDKDVVNVLGGFTIMLDGPGYTQQEFDRQVPFTFRPYRLEVPAAA